ncbi:MAG: MBL fold metallo-hydrolase [Bacteroidales bacterium]|nr:MBL fold metallo-hydrolase [Bacteroidales bacterium]MDE6230453.1 MBL fold metallo-hydrolase [Muribaculaceae bacterium]
MSKKLRFDNHPRLPFDELDLNAGKAFDPGRGGLTDLDEPASAEPRPGRIFYLSLASGSSGNSCYVGTEEGGVIIDAGIRSEQVRDILAANGIPMSSVRGLLLTHDHSDHVKYAYNLLRNNRHITLFCTNRVLNGLLRRHSISRRIKEYHTPIFKEIPFKIAGFEATAFEVPHDGSDNMGFSLEYEGRRFVLATDLGAVTDRARHYMSRANYLVIEANYDSEMLRFGPYPEYLKARIRDVNGHLDNADTARFLKEIVNPDLRYIFLCHLSKDNNTPAKAVKAVREALESDGLTVGSAQETLLDRKADVQLMALPRFDPSRFFVFHR